MSDLTVGLLHPGEMGHTVGASVRTGGARPSSSRGFPATIGSQPGHPTDSAW